MIMTKDIGAFWDERFSAEEYIYGEEPNEYIKEQLKKLKPGRILFAAEGEGRNAVYAATKEWEVVAFDPSEEGKKKALQLAASKNVTIDYHITDVANADFPLESFDALVLIYAHFQEDNRREYHKKLAGFVKKGGYILIEGFSESHLANQKENPKAGGPKNIKMLYNLEELKKDFKDFQFILSEETTTKLNEGDHHVGKADVIRILAKKN